MTSKIVLLLLLLTTLSFSEETITADSSSIKIKLANPSDRYLEIKGINISEEFSSPNLKSLFSIDSIENKVTITIGDFVDFWISDRDSLKITLHGSSDDLTISQKTVRNYFDQPDGSGGISFVEEIDSLFSPEVELKRSGSTYKILTEKEIGLPEYGAEVKAKEKAIEQAYLKYESYHDLFPEISTIILYISVPDFSRKELHLSFSYGD